MIQFACAVVAAYAYAIVAVPLLRIGGRFGLFSAVCVAPIILLDALLIAPDRVVLRAFAEFVAVELYLKMIDFARQNRCRQGESIPLRSYLRFLLPFPVLLVVFGEREKRSSAAPPFVRELAIVVLMGCLIAGGFAGVNVLDANAAIRSSFPLDHAAKLVVFVVWIQSLSRLLWGLERLAGYATTPIVDRAYLATTPGEFWRRWNSRVGLWLYLNIFRPSGGRRAPIRGVFLTFLFSGLFHEVGFAIATSRFTGCQFAFFMLQAPAVAVSNRLQAAIDRAGPGLRTLARGLTVLWFYVTSTFFFEGVNRIFPFVYASRPWLP
jgi:hypothetical protein